MSAEGRPRHVAIYLAARALGSRERVFLAMIRQFLADGCRVDVLAAGPLPWLREHLPDGARVIDTDPSWLRLGSLAAPHAVRVYASARRVARYLERERPDVLFATSIPPNIAALRAKRLARTRTPVVIRQSNTIRIPGSQRYAGVRPRWRDRLLPRIYPRAEAVIAVADGVGDNLSRLVDLPRHRIRVIYNGVALDVVRRRAEASPPHPWLMPEAPPVVLAVGRLVGKKDYPTLLRAFALLRERREACLIILGDGPQRRRLESLARELGIELAVTFPGFTDDPYPYMSHASCLALSSISEGMPSVLIEALACGCPVVSTDCPAGPREILAGGEYGRLTPTGDVQAFADALMETLSAPPPLEVLRGRAEAFDSEAVAKRYRGVLAEVAGDAG